MGRPRKQIDTALVQKLAEMGCTLAEIAAFPGVDCDKSTLSRRFATVIDKGRSIGNISIRRKQFEVAMAGNVAMLIWLGKQWLGQADKIEQALDVAETAVIVEDANWYHNQGRIPANAFGSSDSNSGESGTV